MSEQAPAAEKDALRPSWRRRLSLALNRCAYCGHDRRTQACCGIFYLADRTEMPVATPHTGHRCDCDPCWTRVTPPGGGSDSQAREEKH
jgi:hypothetical protein